MSFVGSGAGTCDEIRAVRKALQSHFSLITKGSVMRRVRAATFFSNHAKNVRKMSKKCLFAQLKLRLSLPGWRKNQNTKMFLFLLN